MKFTLSQILKYSGILVGALGALKIIFAEVEAEVTILSVHWICLIIMGIGALVYFIGVWEKKHENAIASVVSPVVVSPAVTTGSTTTVSATVQPVVSTVVSPVVAA
jgi:hypothetical protein